MKHVLRIVTAVLAATLLTGSGYAIAADCDTGARAKSPGTSMSGASSTVSADPGGEAFEYGLALETGGLPSGGGEASDPSMGKSGDPVPLVEAGGLEYRLGIDTP